MEDTTAPDSTYVPADLTIECSAEELDAVLVKTPLPTTSAVLWWWSTKTNTA